MVGTRRLGPRRHVRDATPFGCAPSARAKVRTIGRLSGIVATARLSVFSATSTSGSRSPKNRMRAGANWPCQQFACAARWCRVARRARETLGARLDHETRGRLDHEIHEERGGRLDHETHETARKARKPPLPHQPSSDEPLTGAASGTRVRLLSRLSRRFAAFRASNAGNVWTTKPTKGRERRESLPSRTRPEYRSNITHRNSICRPPRGAVAFGVLCGTHDTPSSIRRRSIGVYPRRRSRS